MIQLTSMIKYEKICFQLYKENHFVVNNTIKISLTTRFNCYLNKDTWRNEELLSREAHPHRTQTKETRKG